MSNERTIFITVRGGVAYVCDDTVPPDTTVEIIDFDNLEESPEEYLKLSPKALAYVKENFKQSIPKGLV